VENIWQFLRANWLAISSDADDAIVDVCCKAWNRFAANPVVSSIASRRWAEVPPLGPLALISSLHGSAEIMTRASQFAAQS